MAPLIIVYLEQKWENKLHKTQNQGKKELQIIFWFILV